MSTPTNSRIAHLPLTYVRGYYFYCGSYDQHLQGLWCRKCWSKVAPAAKPASKGEQHA